MKGDLPSEEGESNCELQVETEFARQKRQGEEQCADSTSDSREENHCATVLSEETRV